MLFVLGAAQAVAMWMKNTYMSLETCCCSCARMVRLLRWLKNTFQIRLIRIGVQETGARCVELAAGTVQAPRYSQE